MSVTRIQSKLTVRVVVKGYYFISLKILVTAVNAEIIEGKVQRRVDAAGE